MYKLGKLPAKNDPRAPKTQGLKLFGRKAPNKLIRDHIDPAPLMLGNDTLGDCTSAGLGNSLRAQAALSGFSVGVTDAQAVKFYSDSTGYDPGSPSTDRGGVEVDVLGYAARNGYATAGGLLYPVWGSIDIGNMNSVRLVMAAFGSVYLGLQLSESDVYTVEGEVWDTNPPASYGNPTPGTGGGHCALAWQYTGIGDDDLVSIITWGGVRKATNRWLRSRLDEAHAVAWRQLQPASGLFPSGKDWDRLVSENASYLAGPSAG